MFGPHRFTSAPRALDRVVDARCEVRETQLALVISWQMFDQPISNVVIAAQRGRAQFEVKE